MSLIPNAPQLWPFTIKELLDYVENDHTAKTLADTEGVSIFMRAFDEGQGLPEHTALGDVLIQVLEGEIVLTVEGTPIVLCAGQSLIVPAEASRSPKAKVKTKLLVTLVKQLKYKT